MQINSVTYCRRIRRELKCLCGAEKWWAQKYLNLRPADYETRLASPEPHLYSTVNHCFHDLLEQCDIGHTGRRPRMHDLRHIHLQDTTTYGVIS
jgi:hypothetical protein